MRDRKQILYTNTCMEWWHMLIGEILTKLHHSATRSLCRILVYICHYSLTQHNVVVVTTEYRRLRVDRNRPLR